MGYDPVHEMVATGLSPRDARAVGGAWFAAALTLYWLTGARGLIWADPSKLTLYALEGYFPSLNPGDHAGWTVVAGAWLRLVGGDPVLAAHRLSAVCGALVVALAALLVLARRGDRARGPHHGRSPDGRTSALVGGHRRRDLRAGTGGDTRGRAGR